jgi:hypothetical protein
MDGTCDVLSMWLSSRNICWIQSCLINPTLACVESNGEEFVTCHLTYFLPSGNWWGCVRTIYVPLGKGRVSPVFLLLQLINKQLQTTPIWERQVWLPGLALSLTLE